MEEEKPQIRVRRTRQFNRDYFHLPDDVQLLVDKAVLQFTYNPHYPGLRIRKMSGYANIWEARVSKSYRFTFEITDGIYLLRRVGAHDIEKNP